MEKCIPETKKDADFRQRLPYLNVTINVGWFISPESNLSIKIDNSLKLTVGLLDEFLKSWTMSPEGSDVPRRGFRYPAVPRFIGANSAYASASPASPVAHHKRENIS